MPVKIFCRCGSEITHEISTYDMKTRTVFFLEKENRLCLSCLKKSPDAAQTAASARTRRPVTAGG